MRNKLLGDRVRSAVCVVLHDAKRPMRLPEIALAIQALGVPLGLQPTKTLSDALRWEVRRGRVVRDGRGVYKGGPVPRTTLIYMRRRVASYAAGETTHAVIAERRRLSELRRHPRAHDEVALTFGAISASTPRLPLRREPPPD